ncbi:MAG: glycosyltransferase family 39 protein [Candidatus Sumerlaeaceae bacterium]|nr:glycosyltransferase family 39 protein [Candidatus Sumerlaeaceae bacterium]
MDETDKLAGTSRSTNWGWAVALVFAVACLPRFFHLGWESLWFDEAATELYTRGSAMDACRANLGDATPPLYFAALAVWRKIAGTGDGALRAYGALWSVAGLAALWGMASQFGGRRAGLMALALGALAPLDIYYAREARPYGQAGALCTLATWAWMQWMAAEPGRRRGWLIAAGYGIASAGAMLSHYLAAAVIATHGIIGLPLLVRSRRWTAVAQLAGGYLLGTVLLAPWLSALFLRNGGLRLDNVQWMPRPEFLRVAGFPVVDFPYGLGSFSAILTALAFMVFLGLAAVVVSGMMREQDAGRKRVLGCLLGLVALPVLIVYLPSPVLGKHFYFPGRFSLLVLPPMLAFVGVGVTGRRGAVLAAAWGAICVAGIVHQFRTARKTDWREFARVLTASGVTPRVLFYPHYNRIVANRYLEKPLPTYRADDFAADRGRFVSFPVWMVTQKNFPLALQPGEIAMREKVAGFGRGRAIPGPEGLEIREIMVTKKSDQ